MKFHKSSIGLFIIFLIFGLVTTISADGPSDSTNSSTTSTKASSANQDASSGVSMQPGQVLLDPATGKISQVELLSDNPETHLTSGPIDEPGPAVILPDKPVLTQLSGPDGRTMTVSPDAFLNPNDLRLGNLPPNNPTGQNISTATSEFVVVETFEGIFPTSSWANTRTHQWDDVNCFPVDVGGNRSAWPAANVADPCTPGTDYPNNANSFVRFGPFSLADAKAASLDFYLRMDIERCNPIDTCDYVFWGASTDGNDFSGILAAGTHNNSSLFVNGYSFITLDLANVPGLGNLTGQSQVWIGFGFFSNGTNTAEGPFIDLISLRKNSDTRVYLTDETFEDLPGFPKPSWESFDNDGLINGEYFWDDVSNLQGPNCPPRSGFWALWPADEGVNGRDPCLAGDPYTNNMNSWTIYGPFSLEDASEAWVDFHFRNQSEQNADFLFWGASINSTNFFGFRFSGTEINGPYGNGYNLVRFPLSNIPLQGGGALDYRGQPQVWLAFVFTSNATTTAQGPFIDDVSVIVEKNIISQIYLPTLIKSPPIAPPQTNLFIQNATNATVSYTVLNTPEGNITCSNLSPGGPYSCGNSFTPGTYNVNVSTTQCGSNSGQVNFTAGDVTRTVRCITN